MNKRELVANMAESAGILKVAAGKALSSFQETACRRGESVTLVGFATFSVTK